MQAIERFFTDIFKRIFDRATYSATYTAERKLMETFENQYKQATAPKEKKDGDRNV